MAEIQTDLFEGDPDAQQLFDHMDKIPVNELERQWPQMLVALIDVLECEIKRQAKTPHEPRQLARKLAAAMSHYMGGALTIFLMGRYCLTRCAMIKSTGNMMDGT